MKTNYIKGFLFAAVSLLAVGCSEDDFSEKYDINFPVASITSVSKADPFVDDEVTIKGQNLQTATSIAIDAYKFTIVSVAKNGESAVIKVPRSVNAGVLSATNKYQRKFTSEVSLSPQFYPAKITSWPTEIQMGKSITLEGENMDLLQEVKVNGVSVSLAGAASIDKASYSTKEANLSIGDVVTIEVTPKAGDKQESNEITVVAPSSTYIPKSTLLVLDTNADYTIEKGNDFGLCTVNQNETGIFGKALRVTAKNGNGWNGTYLKIYSDNGGKGFDLSNYNNPCITMLINTYGKRGYMQPLTYDGSNGEQDRHLDGKFGYNDDYCSTTTGWEWRSYSLKDLDFPVVKGMIEKIGVQFRGGNVGNGSEETFDIAVNMVMITDGPLAPTVAWDCETPTDAMGQFVLKNSGDGGLKGVNEGTKFASYSTAITGGWSWTTDCTIQVPGVDMSKYSNGLWLNMLINTGNNYGYCQIEYGHDSGLDWLNFTQDQGYGDDYKFVPTENKWVWRSVRFNPSAKGLDPSQPFYLKIGATTGNWESGKFELNVDYIVLTAAPMDPTLNTDGFK